MGLSYSNIHHVRSAIYSYVETDDKQFFIKVLQTILGGESISDLKALHGDVQKELYAWRQVDMVLTKSIQKLEASGSNRLGLRKVSGNIEQNEVGGNNIKF